MLQARMSQSIRNYVDVKLNFERDDMTNFTLADALATLAPGDRVTAFEIEPRTVGRYWTASGDTERTDYASREGDFHHFWQVTANGGTLDGRCAFRTEKAARKVAERLNKALAKMTDEDWQQFDHDAETRVQALHNEVALRHKLGLSVFDRLPSPESTERL